MKDVLALAVQNTYELVLKTGVTAHPATSRYPAWKPDFVIPIMAGGRVEKLFAVEAIYACDVHEDLGGVFGLTDEQRERIYSYREERLATFGFASDGEPYRFYLLKQVADILAPEYIKYIHVSKKLELADLELDQPVASVRLAGIMSDTSSMDLESVVTGQKEGAQIEVYSTKYERSAANRKAAIAAHGLKCQACGFDFAEKYGEIGRDFIEVHHVKPLHTLDEEVVVDPVKDLACLCSNCHRMIHRKRNSVLTLEQLKALIAERE